MTAATCPLCDRPAYANGFCHTHGERWRRWGRPAVGEWVAAFRAGRLNTCEVCGRGWNGHRGSRTCSDECDKARRRRLALARYHAFPPERKRELWERANAAGKARRAATKVTISCAICRAEFLGFPRRKFCSRACKDRDSAIRRVEIRRRRRMLGAIAVGTALRGRLGRGDGDMGARTDGG